MRAAILCRVSTNKQVDGTSLDEQERLCRAEAERLGWQVVYVGRDEGVSGGDLDRDALNTVLARCSSGELDALLVYHQDRLARDEYVRYMAERDLKRFGVRYRPLNLGADVDPFDEKEGEFTAALFGVMAQYQRRQNQWRAAQGQRAKAAQGRWPGGSPPYGYELEGTKRDARPVPCEREREALRLAVNTILDDGQTTGEAAALLNGLGYLTRSGVRWTHQRLRRQLESEGLVGLVYWGKVNRRHGAGHHTKTRPDGKPKYGDPVPLQLDDPPISKERWDALQRVLRDRGYGYKSDSKDYPNSGAETACDGRLGGVYRKDRDLRQYRCDRSKWRADSDERCDCARVNADWLDGQVWTAVTEVLSNPDRLLQLASEYLGLRTSDVEDEALSVGEVARRIAELERAKVEKVRDAFAAGLAADLVTEGVKVLDDQIEWLKAQQAWLESRSADNQAEQDRMVALVDLAERANHRLPTMTLREQREVLRLLQLRVTLLDRTTTPGLRIEGIVPGGGDLFGDPGDAPDTGPGTPTTENIGAPLPRYRPLGLRFRIEPVAA